MAIERIVSHPDANQTEPCLFAVYGVALTVAWRPWPKWNLLNLQNMI